MISIMFNLPAPPGFEGLHPAKPVECYERQLPHWRQNGATYFVTFRLADSLPREKQIELERLRGGRLGAGPTPHTRQAREQATRLLGQRLDQWLDDGMGSCVLREPRHASMVAESLHAFDGDRYELDAYVVMPNHVHVAVRPLRPDEHALEDIVGSWKKFTARRINESLHLSGELWQHESFDTIIRDEEHLCRVIQYIGRNSIKAGLAVSECPRWIRPQWIELGWKFEE